MASMPSTVTKRSCSSSSLHDEEEEEDDVLNELRRGPWTPDEDNLLIHYIACHGECRWNRLAECSGLKRTGKSCRLRWLNYLKPDIKRGNLTLEEQILIIQLHSKLGNRWSRIAKHLPGRTDNEIKNFWRTKVQKQARQCVVNNATFHNTVGCFSIPRVIQDMEKLAQSPPLPPPPTTITTRDEDSLIIEGIHNFNNQYHEVLLMNDTSTCRENYCTLSPTSISSSSISSSPDSIMNSISTFPEISGYPTSPDQAFAGNTTTTSTTSDVDHYAFLEAPGCNYYVMNISNTIYDPEAFINLSSPTSAPGCLLANSVVSGSHVGENNWVPDCDIVDYSLWK